MQHNFTLPEGIDPNRVKRFMKDHFTNVKYHYKDQVYTVSFENEDPVDKKLFKVMFDDWNQVYNPVAQRIHNENVAKVRNDLPHILADKMAERGIGLRELIEEMLK